ncbi:hypothetical protein IFO70_34835 [Phormidium tenue FACHB-886]|nr:hypothetical protein [Phormidium tenue FACHB-886]
MPQLPQCEDCLLHACPPQRVCAVHPAGVEGDCLDFRPAPTTPAEVIGQPAGASYNGEVILQPAGRWSVEQQLELLNWHPCFSGRCPQCQQPIAQQQPHQADWHCTACGWVNESA